MWTARSELLGDARGLRFAVAFDARPATFAEVLHAWQGDAAFRSQFNALLADSPYHAFRWETPPVTTGTVFRPFEFVLLDSPGLPRRPDPEAFTKHFADAEAGVVAFPNLGGDGPADQRRAGVAQHRRGGRVVAPCAARRPPQVLRVRAGQPKARRTRRGSSRSGTIVFSVSAALPPAACPVGHGWYGCMADRFTFCQ